MRMNPNRSALEPAPLLEAELPLALPPDEPLPPFALPDVAPVALELPPELPVDDDASSVDPASEPGSADHRASAARRREKGEKDRWCTAATQRHGRMVIIVAAACASRGARPRSSRGVGPTEHPSRRLYVRLVRLSLCQPRHGEGLDREAPRPRRSTCPPAPPGTAQIIAPIIVMPHTRQIASRTFLSVGRALRSTFAVRRKSQSAKTMKERKRTTAAA